MKFLYLFIFLFPCLSSASNVGKETGLPIPRFVVLKFNESNLRSGPSSKHKISWVYKKKNYPLEVIAEFEHWRKVRDIDGVEGWLNENQITGKHSGIIIKTNMYQEKNRYKLKNNEGIIFRNPSEISYPIAKIEIGSVVKILHCRESWCQIITDTKLKGWYQKENLWGVYKHEIF